ncbi:MAG: cation:proton antiporter, partial [Opitutales bacterium]
MDAGVAFIADLAVVLLTAALGAWAARSLRLTAVVGYLLAGVVVGAPEITVIQVTDALRVQIIAQVGLVFLMFSIGMRVRLREVRRLGWGPLVATVLTALSMLALVRVCSGLLGLDRTQGLFFAAMLMVSSSAIIAKVLSETGRLHERAGQRALSHTLLEDFVAVVMLTVLGSVAAYEQAEAGGWGAVLLSLGKLGAFVILFVVTGLLVLPRLVRRLSPGRSSEQLVVLVAGLLFGLALLTV